MRRVLTLGAVIVLFVAVTVQPKTALAFDTGPHFDITRDALAAKGFGATAIELVQVTNWMTDFYEQASENSYSGHASWYSELILGVYGSRENWPDSVVNAADWLHFDSTPQFTINGTTHRLDSSAAITLEWDRLAHATGTAARDMSDAGDIQGLLTVLGISTHVVQDFYAHTNWVEPSYDTAAVGYDGPGWGRTGNYGLYPTWFDIPAEIRQAANVYSIDGALARNHGYWNSDGNQNLQTALNKDWPGRPLYREAYVTAYFATR
jgi:hypothetical protein